MSAPKDAAAKASPTRLSTGQILILFITALTLARLAALIASPLGLHGDEAQYWSWAQKLDWGYFSKPPMIAWVIAASTALFGDSEWAVRLLSPLIHAVTASLLYLTGKTLWSAKAGLWAAVIFMLMPGIMYSSWLISTDVPLMAFWALGLLSLAKLRVKKPGEEDSAQWRWALVLGAAIGLGMLSKYAMLFFLPALVMATLLDPALRRALWGKKGGLVIAIAVLVLTPNILWNAANKFATVTHTAANANLSGVPFHPTEILEFWASQLGVFGPLLIIFYVTSLVAAFKGKLGDAGQLLAWFVLSPMAVISVEALLSRANANWAVTSYLAASLLLGALVARQGKRKFFYAAIGANIALGLVAGALILSPRLADAAGTANAMKRTRAWPQTTQALWEAAAKGHEGQAYSAMAFDNRIIFYDLVYYSQRAGHADLPLRMWLQTRGIHNHAEATAALEAGGGAPVLLVNHYENFDDKFKEDFAKLERLDDVTIALGGGKVRTLRLWAAYGYTPTQTRE